MFIQNRNYKNVFFFPCVYFHISSKHDFFPLMVDSVALPRKAKKIKGSQMELRKGKGKGKAAEQQATTINNERRSAEQIS